MTSEQQRLCEEHVRYAKALAWQDMKGGDNFEDVASDALLGLCRAAISFDPTRGVAFTNWSARRIRGAIIDGRRSRRAPSRRVMRDAMVLATHERNLSQHSGHDVRADEAGRVLGWDTDRIVDVVNARKALWSLDEVVVEKTGTADKVTRGDRIPSNDPPVGEHIETRDLMRCLTSRKRVVIELFFYQGLGLREIGELLGVGASRACQIKTRALARMRMALEPVAA